MRERMDEARLNMNEDQIEKYQDETAEFLAQPLFGRSLIGIFNFRQEPESRGKEHLSQRI